MMTSSKPTSKDLMPAPFDWIEIPTGHGTMKTDSKHRAHSVTLTIPTEPYWIAKYPVTNAQFAKFIDAGGYTNNNWWTDPGLEVCNENSWTEPLFWKDSKWNGDTQPVVGISWYETMAFCLWLSDTTGEEIMLPTEAQWQYAAQGDDGRPYPWGNTWNRSNCQNSVGGSYGSAGQSNSVTHYEGKGNSPYGVVDMTGNVWEWCLTDYYGNQPVVRGGSWNVHKSDALRCDFRYRAPAYFQTSAIGFRISRSNPDS